MKLHYSQTLKLLLFITERFQYLMKLHYSQTNGGALMTIKEVSVPYEITLLSNLK